MQWQLPKAIDIRRAWVGTSSRKSRRHRDGCGRLRGTRKTRLCARFRSLVRKGKRPTIAATAIARELSAFIWAINREIMGNRQA
jgi:hypothetical protein